MGIYDSEKEARRRVKRKAYYKEYYQANKGKMTNYAKEYRVKNIEKCKEYMLSSRSKMSVFYVAALLHLRISECSLDLIEMKRQQLIVSRQIKSLNKLLKETENG